MASLTTVNSGALTYEQVMRVLVQPLTQKSRFLAAGPRIYDADGNPIRIPKLLTSVAPSWHGEAEEINEVDVDFGSVSLLEGVKSLKSIIPIANELLRASVIPLEAALRDRLVYDQAIKLDNVFFSGDGGTPAGSEPKGMLNWSGIQEIDLGGTADLTFDDILDAVGAAEAAYAEPNVIFMSPQRLTYLSKVKDGMQRYQMTLNPTEAMRHTVAGLPVQTTTHVGDDIVVADMDQVVVARDRTEVRILDQTYGSSDQTAVRVISRYDVAPLNAEGIVVITGANAL